jgi:cysteine-rich repeat protein
MFIIRACTVVVMLAGMIGSSVHAQTTTTTLPPTTYLKCYKAKDPLALRGPAPAWLELDAGGLGDSNCRIVGGFRMVCVPVAASLTAPIEGRLDSGPYMPITPITLPTEEVLGQDRLCYKIRCIEPAGIDTETAFTDQFAARKLSRYKALFTCGPAIASLCGDGNVDFGEDCDDGNRTSGDCCSATCRYEAVTQSCGPDTDGNACTVPRCDGAGTCNQAGFLEPATTVCADTDANPCTKARCDGAGTCDQGGFLEPTTTLCPDTDSNVCTQARCNGAGTCSQTGFLQPTTALCPDTDSNVCTHARCNGAGACSQTGVLEPSTTPCPDTDTNECTHAFCNGAGVCSQTGVLEPPTTPCTDLDSNECTHAHCNGSGACNQLAVVDVDGTPCSDFDGNGCTAAQCNGGTCDQSVAVPVGTFCPDSDLDQCTRAGCDEDGICAQDFFVRNCTLPDVCEPSTGICE